MKSSLGSPPKKEKGESEQEYKQRRTDIKLAARDKKKETVSKGAEKTGEIRTMMKSTKGQSSQQQKDTYGKVSVFNSTTDSCSVSP